VKIAFALLAHGNPRLVERLIRTLIAEGHYVALHYDRKSPDADFRRLREAFAESSSVCFARRVEVAWAEWSIVEATLSCLEAIDRRGWEPDYVYHISGMDYPIRSSAELVAFLERNRGKEFIESVPSDTVPWVRTGPQRERYQYRFYFNWRDQRRRCEFVFGLQKRLGLKRRFVRGMVPYIGSQWWVLTWETLKRVMALARQRDIVRFFRTVLVPDELFFQSMVRHLVPEDRIVSRTLTLYQFSDYGYPVVYYADHLEYLLRQPFFMARKLSSYQPALRDALDPYWRGERQPMRFEDAAIGRKGLEFEAWRLTQREGVPGQRVPGRAPRRRYGDLDRLTVPFFVVIGTSTAELRVVYKALSQHPKVLCHGQLFHKHRIEFANGVASFAGYDEDALKLRAVSPGNFLADVVRAERDRLTGFLLRAEQGWHMPTVMFELPNARVLILRGDPLIAFSEYLLKTEPLLDDAFDRSAVEAIPSAVLAKRFRRFVRSFDEYAAWLNNQAVKAVPSKPRGWVTEIELAAEESPVVLPAAGQLARRRDSAGSGIALLPWHDGSAQLESLLGVELGATVEILGGRELEAERSRLAEWRRLLQARIGSAEPDVPDAEEVPVAADRRVTPIRRWGAD
jgi:hypothetical protein